MNRLERTGAGVVLIVDDVPENLALLHDALDEAGYTVLVATNGESALARARQSVPDVILLDAMMPGIDGFEVARRLKSRAPRRPRIIAITGHSGDDYRRRSLAAGCEQHLIKPVDPETLLRLLE